MMSYDDVILHNMLMYTQLEAGNWGKTVIILMYTAVYITCTAKWCTSVQYTAIHWILQYKVIQYAIQGGPGKKIHRAVCSTPKFGENIVSYRIVTTLDGLSGDVRNPSHTVTCYDNNNHGTWTNTTKQLVRLDHDLLQLLSSGCPPPDNAIPPKLN